MIKADKVCDICGKKRGRPYNHTLCAIKRKAKHGAGKDTPSSKHTYQSEKDLKYMARID